jgi:hypothetical protein
MKEIDEKDPRRSSPGPSIRMMPGELSDADLTNLRSEMEAMGWEFRRAAMLGIRCFRCGGILEPYAPAARFMKRTWCCIACAIEHHRGGRQDQDLGEAIHPKPPKLRKKVVFD